METFPALSWYWKISSQKMLNELSAWEIWWRVGWFRKIVNIIRNREILTVQGNHDLINDLLMVARIVATTVCSCKGMNEYGKLVTRTGWFLLGNVYRGRLWQENRMRLSVQVLCIGAGQRAKDSSLVFLLFLTQNAYRGTVISNRPSVCPPCVVFVKVAAKKGCR